MSLPALPAEIHELIIEFVAKLRYAGRQKALSACALVCASWHSFTLPYTFNKICFPEDDGRRMRLPLSESNNILRLMERNADIGRCVKSIQIIIERQCREAPRPAYTDDDFEQVCRLVSTSVVRLELVGTLQSLASHPLLHSGLFLLLKSPSLRHLKFSQANFKTSFLEAVSRLETLSLDNVRQVILDHQDASKLAKFNKLELLSLLQDVIDDMHNSPDLCRLFARTQHLVVHAYPQKMQTTTLGNVGGVHWASCTLLDLHFRALSSLDRAFFAYCQNIPWSSLSVLKTLRMELFFTYRPLWVSLPTIDQHPGWITYSTRSNRFFLSGASRLTSLESLFLNHQLRLPFASHAGINRALRQLLHDCLEPTFKDRAAFSSLRILGLHVVVSTSPAIEAGMMVEGLRRCIMDCLPSVFGPGGRCEVDGWVVCVTAEFLGKHTEGFEGSFF